MPQKAVAHELDLDDYRASVLPEDKVAYIQMLKDQGHTVIMVGDGINDTPALSTADVSISMQDKFGFSSRTRGHYTCFKQFK